MKLLIMLGVVCAVVVSSVPVNAGVGIPVLAENQLDGQYVAHAHAQRSIRAAEDIQYTQGGSNDRAEKHQKNKQVVKSTSSSKRIRSGSRSGSAYRRSPTRYSRNGYRTRTAGSRYRPAVLV